MYSLLVYFLLYYSILQGHRQKKCHWSLGERNHSLTLRRVDASVVALRTVLLVASSTFYQAALITVGVVVAVHRTGVTVSTRVRPWLIKVIIGRGIVVVRRRGEVVVVDRAGLRSGSWTRFRRLRRLWRIIRRRRRIVAIVANPAAA